MSCDLAGNRRSGQASQAEIVYPPLHLRAQGLSEGDELPANTLCGLWCIYLTYGRGIRPKRYCDLSVRLYVPSSVCPMPLGQIITMHIRAMHYYIGLTGNPMLEDEPAVKGPKRQRSRRRRDIVSPRDTLLIIVVAGAYPAS